MRSPSVSVLVPVYNGAATIGWALASLISQSVDDWEAIVVDDGSTDETSEIVEYIRDDRIRLIRLRENRGRGYARDVGLRIIKGKFVTFLDADDWWYPWKLGRQLEVLESRDGIALVSSAMVCLDEEGEPAGVRRINRQKEGVRVMRAKGSVLGKYPPFAPSMVKSEVAKKVGFSKTLVRSEDRHFLMRIIGSFKWAMMREPLYVYSESRSFMAEGIINRYYWNIRALSELKNVFPKSVLAAIVLIYFKKVWAEMRLHLGLEVGIPKGLRRMSVEEDRAFLEARSVVEGVYRSIYGSGL